MWIEPDQECISGKRLDLGIHELPATVTREHQGLAPQGYEGCAAQLVTQAVEERPVRL